MTRLIFLLIFLSALFARAGAIQRSSAATKGQIWILPDDAHGTPQFVEKEIVRVHQASNTVDGQLCLFVEIPHNADEPIHKFMSGTPYTESVQSFIDQKLKKRGFDFQNVIPENLLTAARDSKAKVFAVDILLDSPLMIHTLVLKNLMDTFNSTHPLDQYPEFLLQEIIHVMIEERNVEFAKNIELAYAEGKCAAALLVIGDAHTATSTAGHPIQSIQSDLIAAGFAARVIE